MSSKLSKRRATVRKPKICVSAACPPPPPPPSWPPDEFPLKFTYRVEEIKVLTEVQWTVTCIREEGTWRWYGFGDAPESPVAEWEVDQISHTAYLIISGYNDSEGEYWIDKSWIAVIWNTPTLYEISDFNLVPDWMVYHLAEFTF